MELYVSASLILPWFHLEFIPANGTEDWALGSTVSMTMAVDWTLFVLK
jgi:hypothetical protein